MAEKVNSVDGKTETDAGGQSLRNDFEFDESALLTEFDFRAGVGTKLRSVSMRICPECQTRR